MSQTFRVTVLGPVLAVLIPRASDPVREGFVRVINHAGEAGEVSIEAIDDRGARAGPVLLTVDGHAAVQLNSNDLERGNPAKGLPHGVGSGEGDWRMVFESELDFEVLSYIRTQDGFLTAMHDVAPKFEGAHNIAMFNPASNRNQESLLRLINPAAEPATVTISGVDDQGTSQGGTVGLSVGAGAAQTISASELESGAGLDGALGDGDGKWRLAVESDRPVVVANLLKSPDGHLTNLSTVPLNGTSGGGSGTPHHVPLFLSASDPHGRQGFMRIINRNAAEATVVIDAYDDTDWDYETVVLTIGPGQAIHFNSQDLELGNAEKGLSGGIGAGEGDWRLQVTGDLDIDVLAYIRTLDGFLTSAHDSVRRTDEGYLVPFFNPGSNPNQVSRLRIVNSNTEEAQVTITGRDDSGASPGTPVILTVPANASRTVTSAELESGGQATEGALGDGSGKWRLRVASEAPVLVQNLLTSPTGHLTNLSTAPGRSGGGTVNRQANSTPIGMESF